MASMSAVAHAFSQTGGQLVDLPAPTIGAVTELGEPCVAGLYRNRGQHADVLVMAAWYCERPAHLVRQKVCDAHHPVLALISLVDDVGSALEPRAKDDKQRAAHVAARKNKMVGANLEQNRLLDSVSTAEGSGDDGKEAERLEENKASKVPAEKDAPLHLDQCQQSGPPPGCVLLCFQHYGYGDGRELFSKAQDEVPTWSGTEVSLTESSLVIGNAEFLSDQEKDRAAVRA